MPTTPVYVLPYLALTDSPDIASLGEDLALAVETELVRVDADITALESPTAVTTEATSATLGTTTSTSYTPTLTTAGVLGVAFVAPTSGKVAVHYGSRGQHSVNGGNTYTCVVIRTGNTPGSGSLVQGSADTWAISSGIVGGTAAIGAGRSKLVSGLTPGDDYNATLEHKIVTAGTGSFLDRSVLVVPVP